MTSSVSRFFLIIYLLNLFQVLLEVLREAYTLAIILLKFEFILKAFCGVIESFSDVIIALTNTCMLKLYILQLNYNSNEKSLKNIF